LTLTLLIPASIIAHLLAAPFTKVEESFNIQAVHDILHYGIPYSDSASYAPLNYDHIEFPGAVPRTFAGALTLSGISYPIVLFLQKPENSQLVGKCYSRIPSIVRN
jgi:alpha-1,6-mannosyltransferase